MNVEEFRDYCLKKQAVTEGFPFGENVLVFKVAGKMFALCDIDKFKSINLKCNPERAIELREQFEGVKPGYHMSKVHWNTVETQSDIADKLMYELIDHSYDLIVQSLTKKVKAEHGF